jgi:hypothetical protein
MSHTSRCWTTEGKQPSKKFSSIVQVCTLVVFYQFYITTDTLVLSSTLKIMVFLSWLLLPVFIGLGVLFAELLP